MIYGYPVDLWTVYRSQQEEMVMWFTVTKATTRCRRSINSRAVEGSDEALINRIQRAIISRRGQPFIMSETTFKFHQIWGVHAMFTIITITVATSVIPYPWQWRMDRTPFLSALKELIQNQVRHFACSFHFWQLEWKCRITKLKKNSLKTRSLSDGTFLSSVCLVHSQIIPLFDDHSYALVAITWPKQQSTSATSKGSWPTTFSCSLLLESIAQDLLIKLEWVLHYILNNKKIIARFQRWLPSCPK